MNRIDLAGRTAVVTGGAKGIGLATAERFLESGAAVSLWDIDENALNEAAALLKNKGTIQAVRCDCGDETSIGDAYLQTVARFPEIDILVANAGVAGVLKSCLETTADDWDHLIRNNLTSIFLTCRAVVPAMVERGYGRVVIMASVVGLTGAVGNGAYASAKGGVITFAKTIGKELASTGVLVNAIAPTGVDTVIFAGLSPEYRDAVVAQNPMGRLGRPEEAAAQIAWLASEDNSFSAGAVYDLSGGRAVY
ncbi:MAG: SDR family oxidoreductase [Rhodospirillales bacterium]|nr:SDR family oxidoreductase [Rhodospirillales bacterium]